LKKEHDTPKLRYDAYHALASLYCIDLLTLWRNIFSLRFIILSFQRVVKYCEILSLQRIILHFPNILLSIQCNDSMHLASFRLDNNAFHQNALAHYLVVLWKDDKTMQNVKTTQCKDMDFAYRLFRCLSGSRLYYKISVAKNQWPLRKTFVYCCKNSAWLNDWNKH
jgi:hypothetical protein